MTRRRFIADEVSGNRALLLGEHADHLVRALRARVGQEFDALVTGASGKGTFVRVMSPPIEGKVVSGGKGLDVGDRVRVRLSHVDVERGFIDFFAVR